MSYYSHRDVYDTKALVKDLMLFALMVVIMKFTKGVGFVLFFFMALWAVTQNQRERLLVLMMIASSALIGNHALMPKSTIFSLTHKALLVMVAVFLTSKLSGRRHSPFVTPFMGLLIYLLWMCISSIQGWCPIISYLKLFLFATCFFAYYSLANSIILDHTVRTIKVRSAYLSLCCFLILGSIALIPFPGISQMQMEDYVEAIKNGQAITSLFCGMTFQPQALGPIVSVIFVVLLCDTLFDVRKANKLILLILLCCPYLIYRTSSRTAMGTLMAGTFFALFLFMRTRQMSSRWKSKVISFFFMLAIAGSILLLMSSSGRERVAKYVMKTEATTSLQGVGIDTIVRSRQGLVDDSKANFKENPLFGNGFQVSRAHIGLKINDVKQILSAPIEKGVWITAVLEEGGVVGFILFVGFGLFAIVKLVSRGANCAASVLFTIFVLNLGEFTVFSMSGIGGFYWCLCFIGAVFDAHRLRGQQEAMLAMQLRQFGR